MDEFSRRYLNDLENQVSKAESEAYRSLVDLYQAQVEIRQAASRQAGAIAKYNEAIRKIRAFSNIPGLTEEAKTRLAEASEYADDAVSTLTKLWHDESVGLLEAAHEILGDDGNEPPGEAKPGE